MWTPCMKREIVSGCYLYKIYRYIDNSLALSRLIHQYSRLLRAPHLLGRSCFVLSSHLRFALVCACMHIFVAWLVDALPSLCSLLKSFQNRAAASPHGWQHMFSDMHCAASKLYLISLTSSLWFLKRRVTLWVIASIQFASVETLVWYVLIRLMSMHAKG